MAAACYFAENNVKPPVGRMRFLCGEKSERDTHEKNRKAVLYLHIGAHPVYHFLRFPESVRLHAALFKP